MISRAEMARIEAAEALKILRAKTSETFRYGLVLGSGLGSLGDALEERIEIPFSDLPGFPQSSVSGHAGSLLAGKLNNMPVIIYSGRAHYYEKGNAGAMRMPIALLKAAGCEAVILTNSAGSLHEQMAPGSAMLINDHINFSGTNPLIGEPTDNRFVGLTEVYDRDLRNAFIRVAAAEDIHLNSGVYMWFSGPTFETPAEIKMSRIMGADAVGMSTVPEAILARFFDMKVVAVSAITNLAAGMTGGELSHDETKENAPKAAVKLKTLISKMVGEAARS